MRNSFKKLQSVKQLEIQDARTYLLFNLFSAEMVKEITLAAEYFIHKLQFTCGYF